VLKNPAALPAAAAKALGSKPQAEGGPEAEIVSRLQVRVKRGQRLQGCPGR
jgi:hypothetical protein